MSTDLAAGRLVGVALGLHAATRHCRRPALRQDRLCCTCGFRADARWPGIGCLVPGASDRARLLASWCGPCRHEQPYITQMAKDLAFQGVRFIGVDFLDRDHAAAAAFVQEFRVPYPSIYDPDGKIAAAYQVDSPPAKVLVDGRGIVVARIDGETTTDKLERLIQAKLLSG